ncbi:hypothetical protein BP6252_00177 [Coleophoma cylindrospora]|uniref:Major facilitator superfamily (MFS) profile domain-containing protein n=1 Tax=Coleophoma cylindrospora TaxID=1849047 RepID=A0A3D8SP95_9HELO|nr:hypothetical protein BP6252_00177 [Coleophoma cylindrospora]
MSFAHKLRVLVWGEAAATAAERKLVQKIDFFVLSDVSPPTPSPEARNLTKSDIVGQVPHALALNYVAPRLYLPSMTVIWAGLTMCSAAVKNYPAMMALRFLLGAIEASTFAGTHYIIGSWYTPQEVGKRAGLFAASGQAGTMFAGLMMTAMYKSMDGLAGMPGWRWVFIIDGIITLPIAVFGFFYFPDLPATTQAPYLSAEERLLAVSRLPPKKTHQKVDLALLKRVLFSWTAWVFVILWFFGGLVESLSTYTCMLLWMKTAGYSVVQNNTYPLVIQAVSIVSILGVSIALDASQKRLPWGLLTCGIQLITGIILLNWSHIGDGARFAAYWIAGTAYAMQPITFTWANIVLARDGDNLARSIVLYSMNGASATASTFWGVELYPATDAATGFFKGNVALVAVSIFTAFWFCLCWVEDRRTLRKFAVEGGLVGSDTEETGASRMGDNAGKDTVIVGEEANEDGDMVANSKGGL